MADKKLKKFPLPPRKGENKSGKKRQRSIYRRAISGATGAPGKLLQRVNQELYKRNAELAARNKTLALLRQLDDISLKALSMREMGNSMAQAIASTLGYDMVSVVSISRRQGKMSVVGMGSTIRWISSLLKQIDQTILVQPDKDGPITAAIQTGQVQYSDNPALIYDENFLEHLVSADITPDQEEIKYSLIFPLRFGSEPIGVLKISASRSLENISEFERDSIIGITGLVALALYKAKLYEDLQTATAQLEQANEQLKDLDKAKSEFLSVASHQLYTPLTALRGYLSMIEEGDFGTTPDKQAPIIDILRKSTDHLITLIKNLLDISRIESGRLELKLESTSLAPLAKQLVQDLMPNAMAKDLDLEFIEPAQPAPHVVVDRERIRQVMLNIIDNAIKYTDQGKIEVRVFSQSSLVVYSVRDTGRGMAPEEIRKLFTKFTRVGGKDRLKAEGTGLGLYVARQMVTEHHGEVEAFSPGSGKGSTFTMKLPAEGTPHSLKVGQRATVEIKAAESKE